VVALKGMFLQFHDLPKAWEVSKVNAFVWATTFLATVVLDIEYGLSAGIMLSIFLLVWCSTHGTLSVLGVYSNYELYAEIATNQNVSVCFSPRLKFKLISCYSKLCFRQRKFQE